MKTLSLDRNYFLLFFFIWLVMGGYFVMTIPKGDIVLLLNTNHSEFLSAFYKMITYLGDGFLFAIVLIAMFFLRYIYTVLVGAVIIIQTLLVQLCKRYLFQGSLRPTAWFENTQELFMIPGVDFHTLNSFPSGHTATAFCIALLIVLLCNNNYIVSLIAFILALFAGLSRIYLLQHFFIDVYFGSLFGVFSAIVGWTIVVKWGSSLPAGSFWFSNVTGRERSNPFSSGDESILTNS